MFEAIKSKFDEIEKANSPKNMSFDYKLMFAYHGAMMILFIIGPIISAKTQILFAISLGAILAAASAIYKVKNGWTWPGIKLMSIPSAIFNILFIYVLIAFSAYAMSPGAHVLDFRVNNLLMLVVEAWPIIMQAISNSTFTPWYMAAVGIAAFSILSNLNLVTLKRSEFQAQCFNN